MRPGLLTKDRGSHHLRYSKCISLNRDVIEKNRRAFLTINLSHVCQSTCDLCDQFVDKCNKHPLY